MSDETGRTVEPTTTTPLPPAAPPAMHAATAKLLSFFRFDHLPPHLQAASKPFHQLAEHIANGPQNPETTVALRKLLEAKDAAVRAHL